MGVGRIHATASLRWLHVGGFVVTAATTACGAVLPVPSPNFGAALVDVDTEPVPADIPPDAPPPAGPVVRLLSGTLAGRPYELIAYRDESGICVATVELDTTGVTCGPPPADGASASHFGTVGVSGGDGMMTRIEGVVGPAVERLVVDAGDATPYDALLLPIAPADAEGSAFVAVVGGGFTVRQLVALDSDGYVLERYSLEADGP